MGIRDDEAGTGQVITLMVAGAIFLAAVGTVLVVSQSASNQPSEAHEANKHLEATGLADILIGSTGIGWSSDPDGLQRLGLLAANGSGLDPDSLQALRGAMADSADNGKVDYDDALESLGMDADGSAGFHLRIYPVGLAEAAVPEDLRVAYIADWSALVDVKVTSTLPVNSESLALKANAALNTTMVAGSIHERQALRDLGVDYKDRVYLTPDTVPDLLVDLPFPLPDKDVWDLLGVGRVLEGDVYPDDKDYLSDVLPDRLELYDAIVVGSGVDHKNLVANDIKDGVKQWVTEGGTLIVLGSADKSTAWLNPLLNVGVNTVNGAPTAPDIAHPLLKEPNDLAWTSYDTHDQGWDIQETGAVAAYEDFSHVVIQGGEDVLAVSKESAFGSGRVILTSFHARDIASAMSQQEATAFLENMITYADRSVLYLDYGGMVPADQPVALAVRQSYLWDGVYGQVPVRVEVLAWG